MVIPSIAAMLLAVVIMAALLTLDWCIWGLALNDHRASIRRAGSMRTDVPVGFKKAA
jgi:hypothetical protein